MQAQQSPQPIAPTLPEPGVPVIHGINWLGIRTLYVKEVRRFFKVQMQTVWAPAITTLMFLAIFTLALGGAKGEVLGFPYATFLAPGLITDRVSAYARENGISMAAPLGEHPLVAETLLDRYEQALVEETAA